MSDYLSSFVGRFMSDLCSEPEFVPVNMLLKSLFK